MNVTTTPLSNAISDDQLASVSNYPRIKISLKSLGLFANSKSHVLFEFAKQP